MLKVVYKCHYEMRLALVSGTHGTDPCMVGSASHYSKQYMVEVNPLTREWMSPLSSHGFSHMVDIVQSGHQPSATLTPVKFSGYDNIHIIFVLPSTESLSGLNQFNITSHRTSMSLLLFVSD